MKLKQHLADRDIVELRAFARNQGLIIENHVAEGSFASELAREMLNPEHVREVWEDLSPQAREALAYLLQDVKGVPTLAFERRFGEIRRIGPGSLQQDQPWKHPQGAGEELWWLGWLARSFREIDDEMVEFISIPEDLRPLLPVDVQNPAEMPFPKPVPAPKVERSLGQMLLDDLGTLLGFVQTHPVKLRADGRWRYGDLKKLQSRLRLSSIRKQPLEAGGPLHLIFFAAKQMGLIVERGGFQRFGQALRPWLEKSREEQMASLFHTWREAETWNDLCLTPGLRCQEGAWTNHPRLAREALLEQLQRAEPGAWYDLDDFVGMIYESMPDFQRPDANYDTWYIQNAAGDFLRGFEHWPAVEGAMIRYIWQGPLFWLGAVALDESGHRWRLTSQGHGFFHGVEPVGQPDAPVLEISKDFTITLRPHIGLWDRLRVELFTFWQASEPVYRYQITQRGLKRARRRGVSAQRVLAFLERASGGNVPDNVRRSLERFSSFSPPRRRS
ncbi:MAG TPA: hypothetical protein ENK60_08935 [Anaerolineae bacterium]|nr:hypothetical protein [Anaerolineae bacterium]